MLVVLIIIQVSTVLLDLVYTKLGRINLLGSQIVGLQLPINLTLLFALGILNPYALHIGTLDNVVPGAIGSLDVWLGGGEEGGLVHSLGEVQCDLVPNGFGLGGHTLHLVPEGVQSLCPGIGDGFGRFLQRSLVEFLTQDLLGGAGGGDGTGTQEEGGCEELHGERCLRAGWREIRDMAK